MKEDILGTQYSFPMWDYNGLIKDGKWEETPAQIIKKNIKSSFGINGVWGDNLNYAQDIDFDKNLTYTKKKINTIVLYKIKCESIIKTAKMYAGKYIWVHKSVLMMHKNSLPFSPEMLEKIFKDSAPVSCPAARPCRKPVSFKL